MSGFADIKKKSTQKIVLEYPQKVAGSLSPAYSAVFAGKISSSGKFGDFLSKLLFGLVVGDYRDWDKIKVWILGNQMVESNRPDYMNCWMEIKNIIIRPENLQDYKETENMIRESFWDVYKPGCNEHLIVHKLRESSDFLKDLDFVACDGGKIIGVAICPKAKIINNRKQEFAVLSMIVGVLPTHQKKGIGTMLIRRIIDEARLLGFKGIVIFGHPEYYSRFGFRNAKEYGIQTAEGENIDPFMAMELSENSLAGISGRFYETSVYHISDEELELFEKGFPHKEKHITDTQLK